MAAHLLVAWHRQLLLNYERIDETAKKSGSNADVAVALIKKTRTDAYHAISAKGKPVADLFQSNDNDLGWSAQTSGGKDFENGIDKGRLTRVNAKPMLIERTYHRLEVAKAYTASNLFKKHGSLNYLYRLLFASKIATASTRSAFPSQGG